VAVQACIVALLGIAALAAGAETPAADGAIDAGETPVAEAEEKPTDPADSGAPAEEKPAEPAEPAASPTDIKPPPAGVPSVPRRGPPLSIEQVFIYADPDQIGLVEDKTISVVGFDFETIKSEGISDIRDLSNFTPALQIKSAFAASNPTIFIRGIGLDDFNANSQSAVAIYQDGIYMQSPAGQLFQFFDVDGVEVLRGPQPSLYRNAEAGAILVRSALPTEEFEGYLSTSYGNFEDMSTEAAVGGPIFSERLLGRLSASWGIRDGITKNRCGSGVISGAQVNRDRCDLSQAQGDLGDVFEYSMDTHTNNADSWAARGQLLLKAPWLLANSDMDWLLNVHGGQNRSRALQYQHRGARFPPVGEIPTEIGGRDQSGYEDTDGNFFEGEYNIDGPEDIDLFGANLKGTLPLGKAFEIRSVSGYEWNDGYTMENSDASPRDILQSEYEDSAWQLSQDFALWGDWNDLIATEIGEGEFKIGGYYLQEDLDVTNNFDELLGAVDHLTQEYTQETRNYSGYAYSEYRLRPGCLTLLPCDFTLTTGLRYNVEDKKFDTFVCQQGGADDPCGFKALDGGNDDTWTGMGGEAGLAWDFDDASSLYVKYTRGWKGGHFNGGAVTVFDVITGVDPEQVDSYEGGLRSLWFDDRFMLNVTGFLYDYQDLQVFIIDQTEGGYPIPKLVNAASANIYGVEVGIGAEPIPDLNLTFNFAWVESEYEEFRISFLETFRPPRPCRTCPPPLPIFIPREYVYDGNPLLGSPRHSMAGSIDYTVELPGTIFGRFLGVLTPRYSFTWRDDVYFDQCSGRGQRCNFPKGFFGQPAYWVHNASLAWTTDDGNFEVMGWVHNFMDEHYKTQNFDLSRGLGVILDAYADPRTYGVTLTLSF
jgi:iron complex outermembrane receptor protein